MIESAAPQRRNADRDLALAVDIGGTRVKTGLVTSDGEIVARSEFLSRPGDSFERQLADVVDHGHAMIERIGEDARSLRGVVLGFPGVVDTQNSKIVAASERKFPNARNWDPATWAQRAFGAPIVIDNDARMALIGEWRFGAGRNFDHLLAVTVGTGLGAAVVVDGNVLRGRAGRAGILGGHTPVPEGTAPCYCGGIGCAEAEASSTYLPRLTATTRSCTADDADRLLDYRNVVAEAERGGACARAVLEHSVRVWATFIHAMATVYDPELLILGGGVLTHHPRLRGDLVSALSVLRERNVWMNSDTLEVTTATLGDDAALAAAHPLLDEFLIPTKEHPRDGDL